VPYIVALRGGEEDVGEERAEDGVDMRYIYNRLGKREGKGAD
jgi:hypothetical protein